MVSTARNRLKRVPRWAWLVVAPVLLRLIYPAAAVWFEPPPEHQELFPGGIMRVGLDPSRPPFAYFDTDGDYRGLEVDLAYTLGDAFDVQVELVPLGFDGLYDAIKTGRADIVIAGQQPNYARDGGGIVYSRHYFDAGLVLVSRGGIEHMRDLPGLTLAYEFGSPADALSHRWLRRIPPYTLRPYELPTHTMMAVHYGEADVALVDRLTALLYIADNPTLKDLQAKTVTNAWYAVTVREGRSDVLHALNTTLKHLHDSGRLDELIDRWI